MLARSFFVKLNLRTIKPLWLHPGGSWRRQVTEGECVF